MRRFLSYLPPSVDEIAPRGACADDPDRRYESLPSVIRRARRKIYKVRSIIEAVVDAARRSSSAASTGAAR